MSEGRLPGSLLVVGMLGLPATPYADAVADALVCDAPAVGRPCGRCAACRLTLAGTHPDRLDVRVVGRQVGIDAVRAAVAWAAFRPQFGSRRVVRLDGADRLGHEAAVAVLKAVEEPGVGVHWVLSADAPGRVSAPLRSRVVTFSLRPVATEEIAAWLVSSGFGADIAHASAIDSDGLPAAALAKAQPPSDADLDETVAALSAWRRRLRAALRAGTISGREARAALRVWARADEGLRRATPPRVVVDALAEALGPEGA
jgi:DNA polymerase-3 subunit delta'